MSRRNNRTSHFSSKQKKNLRTDGLYRYRDISKLDKYNVPYDSIKDMEQFYRDNNPSLEQSKLAKKTANALIKAWRSNSPGTRRRRNSSGTRSRRGSRSNSSGTQGRIISSSRSLHTSDLDL